MPCETPKSRMPLVWLAFLLAGLAGWTYAAWTGDVADQSRAWRALLINFIFFTPLAGGLVLWPAIVRLGRGEWAKGLEEPPLAALSFAPVSLVAFAALWLGRAHWATYDPLLSNAGWLHPSFLFGRDAALLVGWWILAAWFVRRWPNPSNALCGCLALAYGCVFTILGFDLVMALDPKGYSSLLGWYYFVTGAYAAVAAWTLMMLLRPAQATAVEQRADLAKLILAFSLLSMYMMFAQLIVMWYDNLPSEARFIVPRLRFAEYGWVSAALVPTIYLGPLVLLLPFRAKRSRGWLGFMCVMLLAMLWVERWWLVTPMVKGPLAFGLSEFSMTLAFLSAGVLGLIVYNRRASGS